MALWFPFCCDKEPPCDKCAADSDTISVTPSGIVDDDCDCSPMNDTFILKRSPGNACLWQATGQFSCPSAYACGFIITAVAKLFSTSMGGDYGWQVTLLTSNYAFGVRELEVVWNWHSGGITPFDCTAQRTASLFRIIDVNTVIHPCDMAAAACQIN